jgi:hypothetical protein
LAIFGVGSKWNEKELKADFFNEEKFILGWNEDSAKDLYSFVASLKVGDILYIKANAPGSRSIRVKGVGIVTKSLIDCITDGDYGTLSMSEWESLFVKVAWIHKTEFFITIPNEEGRLTNIRAATIYEEYLPIVQQQVVDKIIGT